MIICVHKLPTSCPNLFSGETYNYFNHFYIEIITKIQISQTCSNSGAGGAPHQEPNEKSVPSTPSVITADTRGLIEKLTKFFEAGA